MGIMMFTSVIFSSDNSNGAIAIVLLIPAVFLVFSVALERFGMFLGRKSESEILKFFEEELHALPILDVE